MPTEETVKLHITIQIDVEDTVDTEYTVAEWNALTPGQRAKIRQETWEVAAQEDRGGISVVTDGAVEA